MKKTQWHPIFAKLLRPRIEKHFEMRLNVPVGEMPREADILLLRQIIAGAIPFQGLWRNLTPWNVLEFKGPTVSPRPGDLESLIELGLGINRRLNEERTAQGQSLLIPSDVSFWYLANRLGRSSLRDFRRAVGELQVIGPGLWRCVVLRHLIFLVSGRDLPIEEDSLPLHIVGSEPLETQRAVAAFVASRPELRNEYGGVLATLHPEAWKEVETMPGVKRKRFDFDINALVELVGMKRVVDAIGIANVIKEVGAKKVIEEIGLKQVIDEIRRQGMLDEVGLKEILEKVGIDPFLSSISPAQRRQLKEKLK